MSPALPDGEPMPDGGALPAGAGVGGRRDFGVYLHVPFCRVRCGYCDFNTYTLPELDRPDPTGPGPGALAPATSEPATPAPGGPAPGGPGLGGPERLPASSISSACSSWAKTGGFDPRTAGAQRGRVGELERYAGAAHAELVLAAQVLADGGVAQRPASSVFFGGGTPTMLPVHDLIGLLDAVRQTWGLADGAEVTTEANPDSVDASALRELAEAGFTRVSFGMQSAVPHVLATLERTHTPGQVERAHAWARDAGLATSLDLIYGTPGESLADWRTSLDAVLSLAPDHVSAYALTIEPGTRMGGQLARGLVSPVDPDDQAAKYELADERLGAAGYAWYEISNWSKPGAECRHNLGYWRGQDWWGIGPGAHSYLGGHRPVRWWNVKHPRAYAAALAAGRSPGAGRELLDDDARYLEEVMLRTRLAEGLEIASLRTAGRAAIGGLIADGLIDGRMALASGGGRVVPTLRGRLLADTLTRTLTA